MIEEHEQEELRQRLLREHQDSPHPDLDGSRLRLHVALHTVVEIQLLEGAPEQTQQTLDRLMHQGLSRHEAVHSIAGVVSETMTELMEQGLSFDENRYVERLADLSPEVISGEQN